MSSCYYQQIITEQRIVNLAGIAKTVMSELEHQNYKQTNIHNHCFITTDDKEYHPSSMVSRSLINKYRSSSEHLSGVFDVHIKPIDEILQQSLSSAYINYKDTVFYIEQQELMKRQYQLSQFGTKIRMLGEYYKFHRNIPQWTHSSIASIMEKYNNKVKDIDYKKIKSILKKQQGISITTQQSFSSFEEDSDCTKKSRYSDMLGELDKSDDLNILRQICDKIGKAFKKVNTEQQIKGIYYSGQRKFEQYLKKQKLRKQNIKPNEKHQQELKPSIASSLKKQHQYKQTERKSIDKLQMASKQFSHPNQVLMNPKSQEGSSLNLQKYKRCSTFSLLVNAPSSTTLDFKRKDQIQRLPKSNSKPKQLFASGQPTNNIRQVVKTKSKQKQNPSVTSRRSLSRTKSQTKYLSASKSKPKDINFGHSRQFSKLGKYGTVKTFHIADIINSQNKNHQFQNIKQEKQKLTEGLTKITKKPPRKTISQLTQSKKQTNTHPLASARSKSRSNSHFNPQSTSIFKRDYSKKQLMSSLKSIRSSSKSTTLTGIKGSVIELTQTIKLATSKSKQKQNMMRSNSNSKIALTNSNNKVINSQKINKNRSKPSCFTHANNVQKQNKSNIRNQGHKLINDHHRSYTSHQGSINGILPILTNSINKIDNTKQCSYNQQKSTKKQNSTVQNILDKKLILFKRKHMPS